MQHGTALAAYADFVARKADGLNRGWSVEEGDRGLLTVTGLASISMVVNKHHVVLGGDQETPGPLFLFAGRRGNGKLLAVHRVFACAGGNVPELGRPGGVCRDQSGAVEELQFCDSITEKVCARTSRTHVSTSQILS